MIGEDAHAAVLADEGLLLPGGGGKHRAPASLRQLLRALGARREADGFVSHQQSGRRRRADVARRQEPYSLHVHPARVATIEDHEQALRLYRVDRRGKICGAERAALDIGGGVVGDEIVLRRRLGIVPPTVPRVVDHRGGCGVRLQAVAEPAQAVADPLTGGRRPGEGAHVRGGISAALGVSQHLT